MKVRHKTSQTIGSASKFNTHGIGEMIVCFPEGDMDSDFIKDYEFYIESIDKWMSFSDGCKYGYIEIDIYNTYFWEKKPVSLQG